MLTPVPVTAHNMDQAITDMIQTATTVDLMTAVQTFVAKCQDRIDAHYAATLSNLTPPKLVVKDATRFIRVERHETGSFSGKCIYAFIDKEGGVFQKSTTNKPGDILKPATWRAPAKHARGNVLSEFNGMEAIDPLGTGVCYLR